MSLFAPVGIFDSGVGGLSVLRAMRAMLPQQSFLYFADQAHVPYGERSETQVREFSEEITRFLLSKGACLIVVACNTASAAALYHLRQTFPHTPFVGMEPALKPAVEHTHSGVVGVLATPTTLQGKLYAAVVSRFAQGVRVLTDTCPGLVGQIEQGNLRGAATRAVLESALQPMLAAGADMIVLGCTHYPFVIPLIQEIVGPAVQVIDPAPAVARQIARLLSKDHALPQQHPPSSIYTSGDRHALERVLPLLMGEEYPIQNVTWQDGKIVEVQCIL